MFSFNNLLKTISCKTLILRKKSSSTVFALSSGLGKCGVAVIRVSGCSAANALKKLTNMKDLPEPRAALLRSIKHPTTNEIIDKGLVLWFPGPKSFTGEDSCEFHVHGGVAVINGILDALSNLPDFRLAEPGEFTRQAFLNGKLDLTEVEGLADLLQAETEAQRKQAFLQSDGSLSRLYQKWSQVLKHSVAHIEAHIDFEETETLDHGLLEGVKADVQFLSQEMMKHLKDGRKGEMLRSGVRTVILGEPNVGKSSLLNLLCQRPASIVTPISGTTRDVIEVTLNIGGYPLILCDTAGLRNSSQDIIEVEGMSRAIESYKKADLVILVIDFSSYFSWYLKSESNSFAQYAQKYTKEIGISDLITSNSNNWIKNLKKECIIVLNKTDLDTENICASISNKVVKLSCKNEDGITDLVNTLTKHMKTLCGEPSQEHPSMNQLRHRGQIKECQTHLELFLTEAAKKEAADFVIMAEYLRKALRNLGKLIGTVTSEDILDVIFREFCIGK